MAAPPVPGPHAVGVLVLTVLALILFAWDRLPLETSSLAILTLLALGFEVFPFDVSGVRLHPSEFFHGFGHEALITVCALMMAGQGLVRTGALEPLGRGLTHLWTFRPGLSLLLTLATGAVLSALVNNTAIVVLLMPLLTGVSLRAGTPPSAALMPMGLATLVGGMATTIGTSTNLLVVSVAEDLGLRRFEMFDFVAPVVAAGSVGILYLWLVAPRLLPERTPPLADTSLRVFTAELKATQETLAKGTTLLDVMEKSGGLLRVVSLRRGDATLLPLPDATIHVGDKLQVRDTPKNLKELERVLAARLLIGDRRPADDAQPFSDGEGQLAEVAIAPGSPLERTTLNAMRFADRYKLLPLALHRAGRPFGAGNLSLDDVTLRTGDVLLVQGDPEHIAMVKREAELLVLDAATSLPHSRLAPLTLIIMALAVGSAALGLLPISVSATLGVLIMVLTGCLNWRDATMALSAPVILIVVTSLALGSALVKTGAADYLAASFVARAHDASPAVMLSALMFFMAVLTNVVSNNAAAVIGTPIAVGIARRLDLPPEPFVLAVLFGANMSYATPMAYKTNLLVMNAGGYRFNDFLRAGVPLTILMWAVFSWLLPLHYEF